MDGARYNIGVGKGLNINILCHCLSHRIMLVASNFCKWYMKNKMRQVRSLLSKIYGYLKNSAPTSEDMSAWVTAYAEHSFTVSELKIVSTRWTANSEAFSGFIRILPALLLMLKNFAEKCKEHNRREWARSVLTLMNGDMLFRLAMMADVLVLIHQSVAKSEKHNLNVLEQFVIIREVKAKISLWADKMIEIFAEDFTPVAENSYVEKLLSDFKEFPDLFKIDVTYKTRKVTSRFQHEISLDEYFWTDNIAFEVMSINQRILHDMDNHLQESPFISCLEKTFQLSDRDAENLELAEWFSPMGTLGLCLGYRMLPTYGGKTFWKTLRNHAMELYEESKDSDQNSNLTKVSESDVWTYILLDLQASSSEHQFLSGANDTWGDEFETLLAEVVLFIKRYLIVVATSIASESDFSVQMN